LQTQGRVVGALIMREIHTRFGRDNVGYVWIILEPIILALAVTLLRAGSFHHSDYGMDAVPFCITGYSSFIMFRSVVLRGEGALESNRTLLYHRIVTIADMLFARALLEGVVTMFVFFLLLGGASLLDLGTLPQRPLLFFEGIALLLWFSFALSLLVCAGCEMSSTVSRLIHPAVYILMPLSGAFYLLTWVPDPYRTWMTWVPIVHMFELIREGQFQCYDSPYIDLHYATGWCMVLTLVGFSALSAIRRRLHME